MKKMGLVMMLGILFQGAGVGLFAVTPEISRPTAPLKIIGDVHMFASQSSNSLVPHSLMANLVVTRGGTGVNGLDITIGGVRLIQNAYEHAGSYFAESNQYLAAGGGDLVMVIRPGKGPAGLHAPLTVEKKVDITASARIGSLIAITAPGDVVNIKGVGAPPLGFKQVVAFTWTGGVAPFKISLLRNPTTSPLNFYTKDGVTAHSHGVPLGQFTSGQHYGVHISCRFSDFRFKAGTAVDPASRMTLSFAAMKNFVVNIGR